MTMQGHVEKLKLRMELLEKSVEREHARPLPDQFRLQELKREKLEVKEALTRALGKLDGAHGQPA